MEDKTRLEPEMTTKTNYAGTSPNPASSLTWPMSYTTVSQHNQRPFDSSINSPSLSSSTSMRYDPIRHDHGVAQSPQLSAVLASTELMQLKRKRLEDKLGTHQRTESFAYEPQKIVTPTNSLQSGKRNHVCDICGATFTRQHNLKSHFLTHTSSKKEFICTNCGSEFRRSHDLKRHQKLHTGEKPFACSTCGRRFARADALGRHTKSAGDGGCVNSRKSDSDPETSNEIQQGVHTISPTISHHQSELGSGIASQGVGLANDKVITPGQTNNRNSIADHSDTTTINTNAQNSAKDCQAPSKDSSMSSHTTLPPLHTAFALESDRQERHFVSPTNTRNIMSTPRFGLSFDARPLSTHPLSFDRNSGQDVPSNPNANHSTDIVQPMVPLQRYRQLELEHQAAMERIRHFEEENSQ